MLIKKFNKTFYLHEVILAIVLVAGLSLNLWFGVRYDLFPGYASSVMVIASGLIFLIVIGMLCAVGFKLAFGLNQKPFVLNKNKLLKFLRIYSAIFILLIVYENLQSVIPYLSPIDQDAALLYYDNLLFNFYPTDDWIMRLANPFLTELMNAAYLSFYFYIPIQGAIYYTKNTIVEASRFALVMTLAFVFGFMLYVLVPGVGPIYYLSGQYPVNLDGFYTSVAVKEILDFGGVARNAFPSLHVAGSAIALYFLYKSSRLLFAILLPVIVALWFSTVYLRYHYVIDGVAGLFLAVICIALGTYLLKKWNEEKVFN